MDPAWQQMSDEVWTREQLERAESWRLVERYTEHYPNDFRAIFRKGIDLVELSLTEDQWRAFDYSG